MNDGGDNGARCGGIKVRTDTKKLSYIVVSEEAMDRGRRWFSSEEGISVRVRPKGKVRIGLSAHQELSKVQTRNQNYNNRHARSRHICVGDSVLLLLPTEHNKLTVAWRGPHKVVGKVGNVDYRVEVEPEKVKTYHINMLKQYFHCHEQGLTQMKRTETIWA